MEAPSATPEPNHPQPPLIQQTPDDLKSRLKASYDAIAPAYNTWTTTNHALRLRFLNRLLDHVVVPDPASSSASSSSKDPFILKALELGCGAGVPVVSTLLSSPRGIHFHVVGNDISTTQLALARESVKVQGGPEGRVKWIEGDMMSLSFPECSVDVVVALYSLIHLPRHEQEVMVRRIGAWLRPGGLMLVNFGAEEVEGVEMDGWLGGWMFWSGFGVGGSLEMVRGVGGLEVLSQEVTREDGVDAAFLWVIGRKV